MRLVEVISTFAEYKAADESALDYQPVTRTTAARSTRQLHRPLRSLRIGGEGYTPGYLNYHTVYDVLACPPPRS